MKDIEAIARSIVEREGGFVDDPGDPGGPTNHGVTLATMLRLGLDLDKDGRVTRSDVRALPAERAAKIFVQEFFRRPHLDLLPEVLWDCAFDFYVNAGAAAVRVLQELLNDMGKAIAVDGLVGPQTAAAARQVAKAAPGLVADAYGIARRNYYYALADRNPSLRKFARRLDGGKGGWIRRAEAFMAPRYRLTSTEHAERTRAWG